MLLFFYFTLIFGCKLVILIYFYFVHGEIKLAYLSQRHTKSNPRRFDVDITWICRRENFDKFPCHFHILFQCNFTDRKIHVAFTYFNRYNVTVRKSMSFPRTFFDAISLVEISTLFLPRSVSPCYYLFFATFL